MKLETESGGTQSDPTAGDVAKALRELSADGNSYAILSRSAGDFVQALFRDGQYTVEYHDAASDEHFQGQSALNQQQLIELFELFRRGDAGWKQPVQWQGMELKGRRGCTGASAVLLLVPAGIYLMW